MFDEQDEQSLEQGLNNNQVQEENVEIHVGSRKKNFNDFKIRYKKDKKKYLVAMSALCAMLSMTMGTSYAYLTYVSETNHTVTIDAGQLALSFYNEQNIISIEDAVPVKDQIGLESDQEYSFDVRNNGTIPAIYRITLDNTCTTGANIDVCIPDDYIKVGLKIGNGSYKVIERSGKSEFVIDNGNLQSGGSNSYHMKVWLSHDTPNTYNAAGNQKIVYKGKLGLIYEQGKTNYAKGISASNYTVTHGSNNTTSEILTNATFDGIANEPYFRIHGNASNVDTSWSITDNHSISVIAGNSYTLSFYVRSENAEDTQYMSVGTGNQISTMITWSDSTKTRLSSAKNFANDGNWHLISATFTAPQGVTTATINIGNDEPDLYGTNSYIDIGNIKFTEK